MDIRAFFGGAPPAKKKPEIKIKTAKENDEKKMDIDQAKEDESRDSSEVPVAAVNASLSPSSKSKSGENEEKSNEKDDEDAVASIELDDAPKPLTKKQKRLIIDDDSNGEVEAFKNNSNKECNAIVNNNNNMEKDKTEDNESSSVVDLTKSASIVSKDEIEVIEIKVKQTYEAVVTIEKKTTSNNKRSAKKRKAKDEEDNDNDDDFNEAVGEGEDDKDAVDHSLGLSYSSASAKVSQINALPSKFDPRKEATWPIGSDVPYAFLAKAFAAVEATTKRLKIQEVMSQFFRCVILRSPHDLVRCVYLSCNQIAPAFHGIEIGVGDSLIIKALVGASGRGKASIESEYEKLGDLGLVALNARSNQKTLFGFKPKTLTVKDVHEGLLMIAKESGNKSQDKKVGKMQQMLSCCIGEEAKYLSRALQGKLRIGLAEQSILISLAHALILTPPSDLSEDERMVDLRSTKISDNDVALKLEEAVKIIKRAYSELPCYDEMIPVVLKEGISNLPNYCKPRPGIPLRPMLAKPTKGVRDVLNRFTDISFTCEFKYDGERAQIHRLEDGTMNIYSRNAENNTTKYPDVIATMPLVAKPGVTSFIIDSEAVAYDTESKKLLPFQVLSTRARKDVASADEVKVKVIIVAFDILFLNGKPLLQEPLSKRRQILKDNFTELENKFTFAQYRDSSDPEEIAMFLGEAVQGNCEGLMVKTLHENATYEPSKRSMNWLKLKKDYMDGLTDSLDLVPIGAFHGKGKRTGVYGAYILACYDEDNEEYQSVCKLGTGFSDKQLEEFDAQLRKYALPSKPRNYQCDLEADVWFDAAQVWEVLAADLSISPIHKAALGKVQRDKGVALRFPRFIKIREDKNPEQATTAEQVAEMYKAQNLNGTTNVDEDDDDGYF